MPQARISINGVPGSDNNLPINILVNLNNVNIGGEVSFLWSILDQPPGAVDSLSNATIQNPTFTPKKEGTYLLRLVVNSGLPDEDADTVIAAIRQLKTQERILAAGETLEDDLADGWATAMNSMLRRIDQLLADPGSFVVGANVSGGTLTRGDVVRVTDSSIIKPGLPGQETVPGFSKAPATIVGNVDELLCVVEGDVFGNVNVGIGELCRTRYMGRIANLPIGGGAVGDTVYVTNTATISNTAGTIRRRCGSIIAVLGGGYRDIWYDGVGGQDITPIDVPYVVYGATGVLTNPHRIDGTSADGAVGGIPHVLKAGDLATVAAVLKRFSALGADILQIQDELGTVLAKITVDGNLDLMGLKLWNALFQAANGTTVPLVVKKQAAGATADLVNVKSDVGATWFKIDKDGVVTIVVGSLAMGANTISSTGLYTPQVKIRGNDVDSILEAQSSIGTVLSRITNDGKIDAGNLNILNVATPGVSTDGTPKGYVDDLVQKIVSGLMPSNLVINGDFSINQRFLDTSVASTTSRQNMADKWLEWHTNSSGLIAATCRSVNPAAFAGIPDYNVRLQRTAANAGVGTIYLTQEISRWFIQYMQNQKMWLTFLVKTGANFSGSGGAFTVRLVVNLNSLATDVAGPDYPTNHQTIYTNAFVIGTSAPWTQYAIPIPTTIPNNICGAAVQFYWSPTGTAGANDWIDITNVSLTRGDANLVAADVSKIPPFQYSMFNWGMERILCQHYYEKSYNYETLPGAATAVGAWLTRNHNVLTAPLGQWPLMMHPRLMVPKHMYYRDGSVSAGTGLRWNVWTTGGVATSWEFNDGTNVYLTGIGGIASSGQLVLGSAEAINRTPPIGYSTGHFMVDVDLK